MGGLLFFILFLSSMIKESLCLSQDQKTVVMAVLGVLGGLILAGAVLLLICCKMHYNALDEIAFREEKEKCDHRTKVSTIGIDSSYDLESLQRQTAAYFNRPMPMHIPYEDSFYYPAQDIPEMMILPEPEPRAPPQVFHPQQKKARPQQQQKQPKYPFTHPATQYPPQESQQHFNSTGQEPQQLFSNTGRDPEPQMDEFNDIPVVAPTAPKPKKKKKKKPVKELVPKLEPEPEEPKKLEPIAFEKPALPPVLQPNTEANASRRKALAEDTTLDRTDVLHNEEDLDEQLKVLEFGDTEKKNNLYDDDFDDFDFFMH